MAKSWGGRRQCGFNYWETESEWHSWGHPSTYLLFTGWQGILHDCLPGLKKELFQDVLSRKRWSECQTDNIQRCLLFAYNVLTTVLVSLDPKINNDIGEILLIIWLVPQYFNALFQGFFNNKYWKVDTLISLVSIIDLIMSTTLKFTC